VGTGVGLRSFAALTTGSLLLQVFVNAGVLLTQLSVDGQATAFTASLVAGLAIARIPLFLFNAVQSFLLTRFTVDAQAGRLRSLARSVVVWNAVVLVLGVVWVVLVDVAGASALSFFGPDYELATRQLVLLAASCVFQIATMVTVQGLLALHRDRTSVLAWPVGLVVLLVVFVLPWADLGVAVGGAMLAGTLATFVTAAVGLAWSVRRDATSGSHAPVGADADPVH
jgi:O-antigen/teichoic acid export membrane protein